LEKHANGEIWLALAKACMAAALAFTQKQKALEQVA
jgi:hypothetical protein